MYSPIRLDFLSQYCAALYYSLFIVGIKLNSTDFTPDGFSKADSLYVAQRLAKLGIDFIEVSGGNYERPTMSQATTIVQNLKPSSIPPLSLLVEYLPAVYAHFICTKSDTLSLRSWMR